MTLEKVRKHRFREDLYENFVLQKDSEINKVDRDIIKEILLNEISEYTSS
ncbi:MAG: hypothetical protein ACXABO_01445 [Promethearchaeota archaeon]|jgi:hypothetical protein